jgi:ketosteroid isomerase-like protein
MPGADILDPRHKEDIMTPEPTELVHQVFDALDRLDFPAIRRHLSDDAQAVEEISRRWLRGADEIGDYFSRVGSMISDCRSQLNDIHEVAWGDTALVTCWLEQSYLLERQENHVSAPTTMLMRRKDDVWKIVLMHSVPLPPEG